MIIIISYNIYKYVPTMQPDIHFHLWFAWSMKNLERRKEGRMQWRCNRHGGVKKNIHFVMKIWVHCEPAMEVLFILYNQIHVL